jgi:beta-barrel assembly-enhancing protease
MNVSIYRTLGTGIFLMFVVTLTAWLVPAQTVGRNRLEEKNNPELIGKRDINKGNLSFYSLDREITIGQSLAMEIDQSSQVITDPVVNEFINRIGQNIVLHSDAKIPFKIKVIDSEEVNAFALPGGFLYVNRGLLEAADNEAEVAGVLAHEIAHVAARHGIEQASKGELLNYASLPLIFLGGLGGYIIQQIAGVAIPLTFLKFSRGAETEADRLGAQYTWASGYDPNALVSFFEKLQARDRQPRNGKKAGAMARVFSTHPLTEDRIKNVQSLISLFPDRGEYQLSSSDFAGVKSRLTAAAASSGVADNGRPVLRRKPKKVEEPDEQSTTGEAAPEASSTDRPVLKRRAESENAPSENSPKTSEESGRPVLRKRPDSI